MADLEPAYDLAATGEPVDPEAHLRELNRAALDIARERADLERALAEGRKRLETARAELPVAERTAKTRRQSQLDAVRGRADLERRLQSLIESEALARTRRQQAEQRAQGFRAAATFAASGRSEGGPPDPERLERERLVEARAMREAAVAESRAAEEHAEELKIGKLRAELEMHVAAEREVETAFAQERDEAEKRTAVLHKEISRLVVEIEDAEIALEHLAEAAATIAAERSSLTAEFDDQRRATRETIEVRIVELRGIEADAIRERTQLEAMLADLIAREAADADGGDPIAATLARSAAASDGSSADSKTPAASDSDVAAAPAAKADDAPKTPLYVARPTPAKPAAKAKPTESFIRPERTPFRPAAPAPKTSDDEELIPGLKSLVGNIFTRKTRPETAPEPVEPEESASIADRIARDFGLLGANDEPKK